jgi:hypothetical protein
VRQRRSAGRILPLSLPVVGPRYIRDRGAADDGLTAHLLGLRLFLDQFQHIENAVAGNEADAGIVGDHQIAGFDADPADLDRAVDLDGFEPSFPGNRADFT